MTVRQRQAFPARAGPEPSLSNQEGSGNLRNPGGLYDRRAALALREARSFILVRVNAAELFPVGIINTNEKMMMFAATILAKGSPSSSRAFLRHAFCHIDLPIRTGHLKNYLRGASTAQVPEKVVTRAPLE